MDWVDLISRLGFPVAVCIALGWFIWHIYKASEVREDRLMETNEKAIATIAKYADRLAIIEEDVREIKVIVQGGIANVD